MSTRVKIWDLEAEDGPVEMTMWSIDATEAIERGKGRYARKLPKGKKPGPADERLKAEEAERNGETEKSKGEDPHFPE